jgi:(p)ppGpp synthase/HD superfamily hydrolase
MKVTREVFEQALIFAINAHKGQFRKGDGRPYVLHPISVMDKIYKFKRDSKNLYLLGTVCLLHDTVEDVPAVTIQLIAETFGYHVAGLVEELTLDKSQYEKIGKAEYLAQEVISMSSYALAIKLCDRLDNICDMKGMTEEFQQTYIEETLYIIESLQRNRILTRTQKKLVKAILKEIRTYE